MTTVHKLEPPPPPSALSPRPEFAALAFANAVDGIFVLDTEGRILDLNPAACGLLKAVADEVRGRRLVDFAQGSRLTHWLRSPGRRAGTIASGRLVGRDGSDHSVQMSFNPAAADGTAVIAIARDIGARLAWESTLNGHRTRLVAAERLAMLGSWDWDFQAERAWVSTEVRRLMGWRRTQVINPTLLLRATHRADRKRLRHLFAKLSINPQPFEIEHRVQLPNGQTRYVLVHAKVRYGPDGRPTGIFGTLQDTTERKLLEIARQRVVRAFATLSAANEALVRSSDTRELLTAMCRVAVENGGYPVAWVGLWSAAEPDVLRLETCACARGRCPPEVLELRGQMMEPFLPSLTSGEPRVMRGRGLAATLPWRPAIDFGALRSLAICPLRSGVVTLGVLAIYSRDIDTFDGGELELLARLAADMGYGMSSLHERDERAKARRRWEESLGATITALAGVGELRDPYTAGHQRRVGHLANAIAAEMNLPEEERQGIAIGGLIHDIGKIRVPAEILNRPGRLLDTEREFIQIHPQAGYEVLNGVEFLKPVAEMILQHHERLDGSGYPQGLRGDRIVMGARVLAVADVVEAMAWDRPYRPSPGLDAALEEISMERGRLYDPTVVDACLRLFREKGFTIGE